MLITKKSYNEFIFINKDRTAKFIVGDIAVVQAIQHININLCFGYNFYSI